MLVGNVPFSGDGKNMVMNIQRCEYNLTPRLITTAAKSLIEMLLQKNINLRLGSNGAHEIKEHEFFLNASWENIFYQLETPPFVPKSIRDARVSILDLFVKLIFGRNSSNDIEIDRKYNYLFRGFTFTHDTMEEIPLEQNSEHKVKIYGVDR